MTSVKRELADFEVVADAEGNDGIDGGLVEVFLIFGDLGGDVCLGVRIGSHILAGGAVDGRVELGEAGVAGGVEGDSWRAGEDCADFKGEGEVAASAGDEVSPAGGHGESMLAGVEAEFGSDV